MNEFLESLEARIAPAGMNPVVVVGNDGNAHAPNTVYQNYSNVPDGPRLGFIDATEARFLEADGDVVSIKFSEPILSASTWKLIISGPGAGEGSQPGIDLTKAGLDPKLLRGLDIVVSKFDPASEEPIVIVGTHPGQGIDLTPKVVAHRAADYSHSEGAPLAQAVLETSDGFVNLAFINAAGIDLGDVVVGGNLGKIVAVDNKLGTAGLESLTVESLGALDGMGSVNAESMTSQITGSLKKLNVVHDINEAILWVSGGKKADLLDAHVGGDLVGGDFDYSGSIYVDGTIKKAVVDGDIVGGSDIRAGLIHAENGIKSLTIGGDIVGGSAYGAGRVEGVGGIGTIDVRGGVHAGTDEYAGSIYSTKDIKSVAIGENLLGGDDRGSGAVFADTKIGKAVVHGSLEGGAGEGSGYLQAQKSISKLTVDGDLVGGAGLRSGSVATFDGKIGKIDHAGDSVAGAGISSGAVLNFLNKGAQKTGSSGSVTVDGSTSGVVTSTSGVTVEWGVGNGQHLTGDWILATPLISAGTFNVIISSPTATLQVDIAGGQLNMILEHLNFADGVTSTTLYAKGSNGNISLSELVANYGFTWPEKFLVTQKDDGGVLISLSPQSSGA
jgi:hypothetical protein